MASGTTTAGTVIAAVMESAGYVTQAHILNDFSNFFNSAGALIYTIGAIGGIVSIVLFGSFRVARYMLLGPALFWFAVGAKTTTGAVDWKLGEEAAKDITPWMQEALAGYEPSAASTEVSWFFETFTSTINSAMNAMVGVILNEETSQAALFMSRTRAMEIVLNADIMSPEILSMFENNLFVGCQTMMNTSMALADPSVSQRELDRLTQMVNELDPGDAKDSATEARNRLVQQRNFLTNEFNKHVCDQVRANEHTFDFIVAHQSEPGASKDYVDATQWNDCNSGQPIPPERTLKLCEKDETTGCRAEAILTCNELWDVIEQGLLEHGEFYEKKLQDYHAGGDNQKLCVAIARKMGYPLGDSDTCDLTPILGMYLLRNAISQRSGSRILERVRAKTGSGEMHLLAGRRGNSIALKDENGDITHGRNYAVKDQYNLRFKIEDGQQLVQAYEDTNGNGRVDGKEGGKDIWVPYAKIGQISGHMDAAFEMHQAYQTRGLRQKVYSWAMNLPYYQGVLLYLIAVAYPFLALILLVPSKAKAFLSIPLAWLWIKSWDVGFAMVMVVDDILWNLFPHRDLGVEIQSTGTSYVPDVLTEAFKVDPSYNVHGYFLLVSMCLMAIPPITGYATLKAKSSILASFTDGPKAAAEDAGGKAEGAYGVQAMQRRVQAMRELSGAAKTAPVSSFGAMLGKGGAEGGMSRGAEAAIFGGLDAAGAGMGAAGNWQSTNRPTNPVAGPGPKGPNTGAQRRVNERAAQAGGGSGALSRGDARSNQQANHRARQSNRSSVFGMASAFVEGGADYLGVLLEHDGHYAAAFDKEYGRFGTLTMMQSAAAAAMDAEGGFEVDAPMVGFDAVDKLISLQENRVKRFAKLANQVMGGVINMVGNRTGDWGEGDTKKQIMAAIIGYAPGLLGIANSAADRIAPETKDKIERWVSTQLGTAGAAAMDWMGDFYNPITRDNLSPGQYEYNMISGGFNIANVDY